MATGTDEHLGNDELVYIATTVPTVEEDPTDAAYTVLGMTTGHSLQSQAQVIEIRNKQGSASAVGTETTTFTCSADTSLSGDDGQDDLRTAHFANPKTELWVLATSGVVGERAVWFKAKVSGYNDDSPLDAAATVEFTLALTSAPTFGVVPS